MCRQPRRNRCPSLPLPRCPPASLPLMARGTRTICLLAPFPTPKSIIPLVTIRPGFPDPSSPLPGACRRPAGSHREGAQRGRKRAPGRTPFLGNSRKRCQQGFTQAKPRLAQPIISVNVARQLLQPAGRMQIASHPRFPTGKYLPAEARAPSRWTGSRALQLQVGVMEEGEGLGRLQLRWLRIGASCCSCRASSGTFMSLEGVQTPFGGCHRGHAVPLVLR